MWLALLGGVTKTFENFFKKITIAVSKKSMENALLTDLFYTKKRGKNDHEPFDNESLEPDKPTIKR